ncbi:ZIP family metal transporter [Salinigranum sp. GCM10025319]|uniref:ZIP family metal transporter n=1 Tax=Salinigranum sp. GCM10025319 TaxID=3252687 RepID=UPI00362284DD
MELTTGRRGLISFSSVSRLGLGALAVFVVLSGYAVSAGLWKLLGISWVAFAAMAGAAVVGSRTQDENPTALVWGYGLASGAMITSAAVFLLPSAIGHHAQFGGFGVALGVLVGFGSHSIGHRLAHADLPVDRTVAELSAHALAAGVVIGVVYGNMPELGPLLGLAIVSHKGPAGYAAASRLARNGRDTTTLLLPAVGVGLTAIAAASLQLPTVPALRGIVFGFATGIFLHVAMDFLPRCELGSEIHDALAVDGDAHALLDRLRLHAVASTGLGGLVVFVAWLALA